MLDDLQRKLEIGSHGERLRTVRELGAMNTREAYGLLELAAQDIDPQIQAEAGRAMQESAYYGGSVPAARVRESEGRASEGQESFF